MSNLTNQLESATKPVFDSAIAALKENYEDRVSAQGTGERAIASYVYDFVAILLSFFTQFVIPAAMVFGYVTITGAKAAYELAQDLYLRYQTSGLPERIADVLQTAKDKNTDA